MKVAIMALGTVALLVLAILYGCFTGSFILYKFWHWFLLPVFPTLPAITFYQALSVSLFLMVVKPSGVKDQLVFEGKEIERKPEWVRAFAWPWILFLIGYAIKVIFLN